MGNPLWLYDESDVYHWLMFSATHPNVLRRLAGHFDENVRSLVARHPNCSIDILRMLVVDESSTVRGWAVLHPAMTEELTLLNKAYLQTTYLNRISEIKKL